MRHISRSIVGLTSLIVVMMVLAGPAAPAAASGGLVIYVNDTIANDPTPTYCPATPYTTIAGGVGAIATSSNVTLTICPGSYTTAAVSLSGFTNLKVIGKGGPVISAPVGFSGNLFNFTASSNVTVQGLNIDGKGNLGAGATAIDFYDTSGTIKSNYITHWHEPYAGPPPFAPAGTATGIVAYQYDYAANVTIQQNTLYDVQDFGIWVMEPHAGGKAKIVKNRITFTSKLTPNATLATEPSQAGIVMMFSAPGTTISGNQISNDADTYPPGNGRNYGILLYSTNGAKVTGNIVRGLMFPVAIVSYCEYSGYSNANSNVISGNNLYDVWYDGVLLISTTGLSAVCGTPHVDMNQVKSNKIYSSSPTSALPYGVEVLNGAGVVAGNAITGNTFAGFLDVAHAIQLSGTGITGTVTSPNKYLPAPPAGAMSASAALPPRDGLPAFHLPADMPPPPK